MGNSTSSRSQNPATITRGGHDAERFTAMSGADKHHMKHAGSKLPPLHVVKDSATQTYESGSRVNSVIVSLSSLFILLSVAYFSVCYTIISSEYVQSLIVYSHYVKKDLPLLQLHKIGLPEARNIEIITEDGILLRGYHLMNPGAELVQANQLNDSARDAYFERTLAFTERVVVYFHGNSETRAQNFRLRKIKQLAVYLNAHVIAFDYRGFADSEGFPSESGTHLDSRAVVHYIDNIVRRYNPRATGYLTQSFDQDSDKLDTAVADAIGENNNVFSRLLEMLHLQEHNHTALSDDGYRVLRAKTGGEEVDIQAIDARSAAQPHLFLYGHSLGAAISMALAVEVSTLRPGALSGLILDCPFTELAEAMRGHPLTKPFRTFPRIFASMVANLMFKYSNMDRIRLVNAPVMLLHGETDFKIRKFHSQQLFLRATNATELPPATALLGGHAGVNAKQVTIHPQSHSQKDNAINSTIDCAFPVELHIVPEAGHNEVYATKEWVVLLPDFVQRSEEFARANKGNCFV